MPDPPFVASPAPAPAAPAPAGGRRASPAPPVLGDCERKPGGTFHSLVTRVSIGVESGTTETAYCSTLNLRPARLATYRRASPSGTLVSAIVMRASLGSTAGMTAGAAPGATGSTRPGMPPGTAGTPAAGAGAPPP